jgi:hypothetical protein
MNRVINFRSIWSATALAVFISSEIAIVAAATVWALIGLFHLGALPAYVLSAAVGIPAAYAILKVSLLSFAAETDPENN